MLGWLLGPYSHAISSDPFTSPTERRRRLGLQCNMRRFIWDSNLPGGRLRRPCAWRVPHTWRVSKVWFGTAVKITQGFCLAKVTCMLTGLEVAGRPDVAEKVEFFSGRPLSATATACASPPLHGDCRFARCRPGFARLVACVVSCVSDAVTRDQRKVVRNARWPQRAAGSAWRTALAARASRLRARPGPVGSRVITSALRTAGCWNRSG